ncbi:glycosyltransferase family 39 protein, partial [Crocinitomicaceae bacterium]|nr:glycosyltransferase family 39 protein [Crocinitomicaceae bacterium]
MFKNISKNWKTIALATSVFLFLFFFLGYHNVFFRGPYGMHFMRQTDSLSFVSQYFNNGFHLFDPQLFNLKNIDGRAACEFPILYYITSLLYIIIGKKLFLLKFIYLLISFTGLFYVYRLSYLILKDQIYAIFTALFLCTSTVFNFYAFNYLPDAPALGFVFIAWYYGFQFSLKGEKSALIKAFAFFTLGSLIKVTYLINPIAFIVYFAYLQIFQKQAISKLRYKVSLLKWGAINLLLVGSWNAYMLYYNQQYDSHSFNTSALPIWELNNQNIVLTWDYMMNFWYSSYFAHSSFHFLLIIFIFQIIYLKKSNYNLSLLTAFMLIGSLSFGL